MFSECFHPWAEEAVAVEAAVAVEVAAVEAVGAVVAAVPRPDQALLAGTALAIWSLWR